MNRHLKMMYTLAVAALLAAANSNFQTAHAGKSFDSDRFQGINKLARRTPEIVPGRFIVKYRGGVSAMRRSNLMMAAGARIERDISGLGMQVVEVPEGADAEAYVKVLRSRPEVEYVEPDYLVYPVAEMTPDDPMYPSQWHLPVIGCPSAWGMTSGSEQITIALCDTGVDSGHPDLGSKLVPGWNVVDGNTDTTPVSSHGTWTAGTAAATGNNSIGVAAPALSCRIMPVRVSSLSSGAALISDLAAGVIWAADHGARVASVSYMAAAASTNTMSDAGKYIASKGGVLVVAAGNTGTYFDVPDSPDMIVVSATGTGDSLAGFTTRGLYVDLSAPGSSILTTAPGGTYQSVNGTSFSTPLVAGAIGLMLSVNPSLTAAQIDTILKVTADDFGPAGWDPGYGWGRLNVGRAVDAAQALLLGNPDTLAPALGFAQPQVGGSQNGLIGISSGELVRVNALDDRSVASVSLQVDGSPAGSDAAAPYAFYCDTSAWTDGSQHTLAATATDQAGNTRTISMVVTAKSTFDATPPTAAFLKPVVSGASATVTKSAAEPVQVDAQDNKGVASVALYADGSLIGTVTSAPYSFAWNTSSLAAGSQHVLEALAADAAGNYTVAHLSVTVQASSDATPPSVSFAQPAQGSSVAVSSAVPVVVNASDNVGVAAVNLYADGAFVGTDAAAPYEFSWDASAVEAGSQHTLRAVATDGAGNRAEASITVTVKAGDVVPPEVSFTNPEDGGWLSGNINVSIDASDNVAVTLVEFYADDRLVKSWKRAPYAVKWSTKSLKKGEHVLTCKAYDAAGNSATASIGVSK